MLLVAVHRYALFLLVPLSLVLSSYLYLYPVFHQCAFPAPNSDAASSYSSTLRQHTPFSDGPARAPFRLLALGDPQLEGDTSIPGPEAVSFPNFNNFWKDALLLEGVEHTLLQRLRHSLHDLIDFYLDDIPKALQVWRKRVDLVGNDYYLGHIYRTLHWWTQPTHVTVLGDLVGSQWIDDEEFESRGWRFWRRVFSGGERVPDEIVSSPSNGFQQDARLLGEDAEAWKRRIINVAGNHDVGYAGDLSPERMTRFERVFGKPNYELRFQLPSESTSNTTRSQTEGEIATQKAVPELRIIVFNDMNLDTPASSTEMQSETYEFLNGMITTSHDVEREGLFTLLLTHIPMYKKEGVCVDGPFFDFFENEYENGVREQNHLSSDASKGFLEGIFGMSGDKEVSGRGLGRHGLILTGHDHEGCDTYHHINQSADVSERHWEATRWKEAQAQTLPGQADLPGLREITVRSMMGDYSGNAGLLSLWFDEDNWEWRFEFANCSIGKQHIWWVVHVLDLVTLGVGISFGILTLLGKLMPERSASKTKKLMSKDKVGASTISGQSKKPKKGVTDLVDGLNLNHRLDIPGSGKKSLRKKRSKTMLSGSSSPNPFAI